MSRITADLKFPRRSEADVMSSVKDLLKRLGIWHLRCNVGAATDRRGQTVRFGTPGCADFMVALNGGSGCARILWLELKAPGKHQSPDQKFFQRVVENEGMSYFVATSAADVVDWLRANGFMP